MQPLRAAVMLLLAAAILAAPGVAKALIGIRVDVIGDASGTLAAGVQESDGPVTVTPAPGDSQLTFRVIMDATKTISAYVGLHTIDGGEIGFTAGSDLSGLGFLPGFEGDPAAVSQSGSVTTALLYEVIYAVGALDGTPGIDWEVDVTEVQQGFPGENNVDPGANAASIRIDAPAPSVPALNWAAIMILLGSGFPVFLFRVRRRGPKRRSHVGG